MNESGKNAILLVEDESLIAMAEKMNLEKFGYDVITANSGKDAISVFNNNKFDIILMDIDLGIGMDGTEAAEIILKDNDIPIVFLSSHTEQKIVEKTEKITSYGYVVKNSGITILDASLKMAFKLFVEKQNVRKHQQELTAINEKLKSSQNEILKREEALQESEDRFRGVFEHTNSGVAVYKAVDDGKDFIFLNFNSTGEKIDGVRREKIIGKRVAEVFPGVKQFGLLEVFSRVWKTGKPEHYPISMYKDDRIQGWRENFVYRLSNGEVVAVYEDITERKQIEEAQKKSLKDNKILLRELQHRAKNSFTMIYS